jgi:uncharacterized protein YbjT (DUF2867 family)
VVAGDPLEPATLPPALAGVHTAVYLIHSLAAGSRFQEEDRRAAESFGRAAGEAGVRRIIYLGGLGRADRETLSTHLASRQEVGEALRASGVPVIEFRASIVIGSGSLSFEMVRALVERLPVLLTPRWVATLAQPIAIEDLLQYLLRAVESDLGEGAVFEIGGADRVSYGGIMQEYARQRGLRRPMLHLPFLTPWLSSHWLGLVTPLYAAVGRHLIAGVRNETVVTDPRAEEVFRVRPMGITRAVQRALANEDAEFARTHWTDSLAHRSLERHWGGYRFGTRLVDSQTLEIPHPPHLVFDHVRCLGGATGYFGHDWLWALRGLADNLLGGVGLKRGRRDWRDLRAGDCLDFWRVEALEPGRRLLLHAEMRMPGRGWLQLEVDPAAEGSSRITLTAMYDPLGLRGLAYWYAVYPFHHIIFGAMLRGIARAACRPPACPGGQGRGEEVRASPGRRPGA